MPSHRTVLQAVFIVAITALCAVDGDAAKASKAPDMAGVWSLTDTVDSSTCSDVKVGTKRAMLLTIDQENKDDDAGEMGILTAAAVGSTAHEKYTGKVGGALGSEFELNAHVGIASSKLSGKAIKKKLTGTRREVASNSCTVTSTFTAKQL